MKTVYSFMLICVTLMCLSCEQWATASETIDQTEQNMPSSVTAADYGGTLPVASISCPDAGNLANAEDVREIAATLLAIQDNLQNGIDDKVERAGDTMTGALSVEPTIPSNAITGVGNGVGAGLVGIGGVNGPGLVAGSITLPTATAPTKGAEISGFVKISGDSPNPNVDPGDNNALHASNIPKTWARIASRSGDSDSTRIKDGHNIASVTTTATSCTVAFVRPITTDYAVEISIMGGAPYAIFRTVSETSTGFIITGHYMPSDLDVAFQTAGQLDIALVVHGRQ